MSPCLIVIALFLCVRHSFKPSHLILIIPCSRCYYYPHFIHKETKHQSVIQLVPAQPEHSCSELVYSSEFCSTMPTVRADFFLNPVCCTNCWVRAPLSGDEPSWMLGLRWRSHEKCECIRRRLYCRSQWLASLQTKQFFTTVPCRQPHTGWFFPSKQQQLNPQALSEQLYAASGSTASQKS